MNKATFSIFSALLADYIMVTIIVPIINDLFKIDYGKIDEFKVGFVYSMKGLSQLCTGLLIGRISDKLQLKTMTQLGLLSDLLASLIYIFGRKFPCYLLARMFHGIGSSLIASSSFSLLANQYKTDKERGEIMSKAGSGIACGVLCGPVVGGLLYSLGEKMGLGNFARLIPFACCSLADLLSICAVHFFINSPYRLKKKHNHRSLEEEKSTNKNNKSSLSPITKNLSNFEILKYIPIFALVYLSFAGNLQTAYIEPILPNYWMKLTDNNWNTFKSGILFAFSPLSYTILMPILGKYGYKIGRHNVILIGMLVISSISLIILPSKKTIYLSAIFLFLMGCGSGAIDASLQPMLAQAYDNLLERKQIEKEKNKIKNSDNTIDSLSLNENESSIKLNIDSIKNDSITNDSSSIHRDIGDHNTPENNMKINNENNNENENDNENDNEEESEEAHNKYTRVFSLGNMAMNIGFITGPMLSSFIVSLIKGEEPNKNRFNSSFFKCCLIFTIFGCLSALVAIIPGMKKYQSKKNTNESEKSI
ncbi:MFS general substrate transporter [Piromyces finnis]|uniref:MFS general substrate transporter n=1 Tax=Piromyces finnis TaxID=1754191 RepID=A0A1Y1V6Y3_9FUNG|nr:MFS general substrate transporter [Piromyces finnis]|eukprot:ORX48704.1 MFS general substrate transporter [Piromyces finnis]